MLALGLIGCQPDAGTFSVSFTGVPAGTEFFVIARVETEGIDGTRQLVAPAGPELFSDQLQLEFSSVPHQENLEVVAELRETPSLTSPIRYYGKSETFALRPGEHIDVPVRLQLRPPPTVGTSTVRIIADSRFVSTSTVELELDSSGAITAVVSNDATLSGSSRKQIALTPGTGPTRIPWNLDDGVDDPCVESDLCPRTVFARFVDNEDYPSDILSVEVTLDTKAPTARSGDAIRPGLAASGELVQVTIVASETLARVPTLSLDAPGDLTFSLIEPRMNVPATIYILQSDFVVDELGESREYEVRANLEDLAGNKKLSEFIGTFEGDIVKSCV